MNGPARRQLTNVVAWYRDQAPGQATRFIDQVSQARRRIADWPDSGRPFPDGTRRIATKVFPYHLWYIIEDNKPLIIAVTHFHRDTNQILP